MSETGSEGRPVDRGRIDRGRAVAWLRGNEDFALLFERGSEGVWNAGIGRWAVGGVANKDTVAGQTGRP